jgi:hypothetical protein
MQGVQYAKYPKYFWGINKDIDCALPKLIKALAARD